MRIPSRIRPDSLGRNLVSAQVLIMTRAAVPPRRHSGASRNQVRHAIHRLRSMSRRIPNRRARHAVLQEGGKWVSSGRLPLSLPLIRSSFHELRLTLWNPDPMRRLRNPRRGSRSVESRTLTPRAWLPPDRGASPELVARDHGFMRRPATISSRCPASVNQEPCTQLKWSPPAPPDPARPSVQS